MLYHYVVRNTEATVVVLVGNRTRVHPMAAVALTQPFFAMAETWKVEAEI